MATIDLILRAINKATGPLKEIADAAGKAADKIDALNDRIDKTDRAMASLEGAARAAEAGMRAAGREAGLLGGKLSDLSDKLDRLDRTVTAKVRVVVDQSALATLTGRGGRRGTAGGLAAMLGPGGVGAGTAFAGLPLLAQGGVVGVVASAAPFIATALSGAIVGALGTALTGLGIAGALKSQLPATITTAQSSYQTASTNLNTAIHTSPADLKAYQGVLKGLEPDLARAAVLLANQNVVWQNLTPAQQNAETALRNNSAAYKTLLPDQKLALEALLKQRDAWNALSPAQQKAARATAGMQNSLANLQQTASDALTKIGAPFVKVLGTIFDSASTLITKLTPVFVAVEKVIAGPLQLIGTTLTSSLASPRVVQAIGQVGKAFAQFLGAFAPQIPGIVNALATGVLSMANSFTRHPDMIKAMAAVVAFLFKLPGYVFSALAALSNVAHWLATGLPHEVSRGIDFTRKLLISFGHDTAAEFGHVLRDTRTIWNDVYGATIGVAIRIGHDVETQWDSLRHGTASAFDHVRHDIAGAWNDIWLNTVSRAANGVSDVIRWLKTLPGRAVSAVGDAGKVLYDWGAGVLRGLLHGFSSVWDTVKNFFTSLPGKILGWLGIHSPPQWSIDAGMHMATGIGIGLQKAKDRVSSATAALKNHVVGGLQNPGGPAAGSAVQAQQMAMKMAALVGWTGGLWTDLNNLVMRESGWSMTATNPASGAYGIAQGITGPSWYYQWPGGDPNTLFGQLTGLFDYIGSRYGNPASAWAHETNAGWYAGGTGSAAPGWAWVGERGRELVHFRGGETVLPHAQSMRVAGGYASGTTDAALLRSLEASLKTASTVAALHADEKAFFKLIADNYTGSARRWRDKMVERQVSAATATLNALAKVGSKIAAAQSYQQSVQSGLSGYARAQDMSIGGAYVGGKLQTGAQFLNTQLRGKLSTLRAFSAALKKLTRMHAPSSLIQSVVDLGPDQGIQLANELLADPKMLKTIGATQAAISSTETAISRGAASAVYEGKYDTSKNFLSGLTREQAGLERVFKNLGRALGQEAAWWIGHQAPAHHSHRIHHLRHRHPRHASGGIIAEPVYSEAGFEPGLPGRGGPLIHIGEMHVHDEADATMVAQRLSAMIRLHGAGFGGGFR